VDTRTVRARSAPDVLADVNGHGAAQDVVLDGWSVCEERVELELVELGEDVWNAVVHPGEVRFPVVFARGPSCGVW